MKQILIASSELLLLGGYAYKWKTVDKTVELLTARQMELEKQKEPITTKKTITASNRKRLRHELEGTTTTAEEVVKKARKMMGNDDCKDKPIDILVVADAIRREREQANEKSSHTFERDLELPGVKRSVQVTCSNIEFGDDGDDIILKKTSAGKLWKRAWPSDVAKAHVLMFITRNKTVKLEERTKHGTEVYKKTIDWNDDRWRDITQRLTKAVLKIEANLKTN
jgi:hypothetical protein